MISIQLPTGRLAVLVEDVRKVPAFFRRDILVMLSYRFALVSDWLNLVFQVLVFYFVGKLVPSSTMPSFDGSQPSYMQFVVAGIVLTAFLQIGISRVVAVMRQEQYMGTLEPLLVAPMSPGTMLLGSVIYDLLYVPIRSVAFLGMATVVFDLSFHTGGFGPALAVLIAFIPFVWGLGMVGAAGILTFKRGAGVVGFAGAVLSIASGTYFPVRILPGWLQAIAAFNPVTIALDATRGALIGSRGWIETVPEVLKILPASAAALLAGLAAFEFALRRERRRGSVGVY